MPKALAPKLLLGTLALTLAVVCVVTLGLYGNTSRLVSSFLNESVKQRTDNLQQAFLRQAEDSTGSLEREIDSLVRDREDSELRQSLIEFLEQAPDLTGIAVFDVSGDVIARVGSMGQAASAATGPDSFWTPDALFTAQTIRIGSGPELGLIRARFRLDSLEAEINTFRDRLVASQQTYQREATIWVAVTALVMAIACALIAWVTARRLVTPINQITRQANELRRGQYGQSLPVERNDELGELARAFNDMRDQLRQTTISRDYVDSILSSMNDAVIVTGDDGTITHCNSATLKLLGFTETQLLGRKIDSLVPDSVRDRFQASTLGDHPKETRFTTASGEEIPVSWTGSTIYSDNPLFAGRIYAAQNISERKRAEQRIRFLARIDPLTRIPNRMQFQHLLQRSIARCRRDNSELALFYLDIDQFKDINDTFGHLAGDSTLETLTRRMTECMPEGAIAGRLAGDEFAVFIEALPAVEVTDLQDALRGMARHLLERIAEPFNVQGNEVYMTASLGIALYPADADNVIDLIRNADAALYAAKKAGGNRYQFYDASMNEAAIERLMLKSRLRRSFEEDELLMHYQPKYSLQSGKVVGAEALVRWDVPERGRIQPADFIPLAEETNLIIEIGEWVLEKVCADIQRWQREVGETGRIAVNLSLRQLRQKSFIKKIDKIIRRYDIDPANIEFEITETTLVEDPQRTIGLLDQLHALGLHLAIDDFGTGYSSLSALQKFPINTLKIDRSFVKNAADDANDAAIVSTIIDMGRSLKLDVVAEGVETQEQLNFLRHLKCDYAQGMLFGEPMEADSFRELLIAQQDGTDHHLALFA
jgi:diguanylate cyclase (GGDEF)-like protein/PAS domain S-box-containing protein